MTISRAATIRVLARIHPEIWEIIGGGPLGRHTQHLGPHPEPWKAGPTPEPWRADLDVSWALSAQLAAVNLTRRLTDAASLIHAQNGRGPDFLRALTEDDWCPSGVPIKLNLPPGWWIKWPDPPPRPDELNLLAVVAAAGLSFAALGDSIKDKVLSQAVVEAGLKVLDMAAESSAKLNLEAGGRL